MKDSSFCGKAATDASVDHSALPKAAVRAGFRRTECLALLGGLAIRRGEGPFKPRASGSSVGASAETDNVASTAGRSIILRNQVKWQVRLSRS
jgi:hypothetical protein